MTKRPRNETLMNIAAALGVPLKVLLSKKTPKGDMPTIDDVEAVWDSLDDGNKQVVLIAAKEILKKQQGEK